ncbi:hypothetical protein CRM22_000073 [Opisthorchis felineus]|uniref:Uncharacterized protein n=1 Tax=Opisthorchis felineus TaxID=147828 RepID=A0A4S2MGN5_OPIFE|nr:hypothetical protein CRM22_000073 [Opisthorchis felineus]
MHLSIVTILGGLLCSQVLGNPQLKLFEKGQTGLQSNKIIHSSNESLANRETDPSKSVDDSTNQEDKTTHENAEVPKTRSAKFYANSPEQNKSSTQNTNEADLQTPSMRKTRDILIRLGRRKPKFERHPKPEIPFDDPDVERLPECRCTYSDLKAMLNALRYAEYVLEDVMLHLGRTKKIQQLVSNLLKSMDHTFRGKSWPM